MNTRITFAVAMLATLLLSTFTAVNAGEHCHHCGCSACCEKVCRLVVEDKKVDVICWGCKCEDFCLPGPSCRGCKNCDEVCNFCDEKDPKAPCAQPQKFVWYDWIPNPCADLHTKKKLMKRTVTKTVPGYKWVVEDLCPGCEQKAVGAAITAGTEVPAPPLPNAKLKYSYADAQDVDSVR
jgi:hypothetical protein